MEICHLEDVIFRTFSVEFCPLLLVRVLLFFFFLIQNDIKRGGIFLTHSGVWESYVEGHVWAYARSHSLVVWIEMVR